MANLPEHISVLLSGKALRALDSQQEQVLQDWMAAHPEHQCLLDAVSEPGKQALAKDIVHMARTGNQWEKSYKEFASRHLSKLPKQAGQSRLLILRRWYTAAAAVLIFIMAGWGIYKYWAAASFKSTPDKSIVAARPMAEIILANGQKIQLGSVAATAAPASDAAGQGLGSALGNGSLSQAAVIDTSWYRKLSAGMHGKDSTSRLATLSFSIVTPKGGKYALELPDGSKVWMGAASRLRYSQTASPAGRHVDMEGEVYFEIAKQSYQQNGTGKTLWRPFKVQADGMAIEVLGTRFTVAAYPGSAVQTTTLFEGKVKVSNGQQNLFLSPGQRADLKGGVLTSRSVDNSQGVALKEGYFIFRAETLSDILKEVGNWYNINVVFRDPQLGQERFEAMLPRSGQLADLLSAIEGTGNTPFTFKFKDRTLYVDKK